MNLNITNRENNGFVLVLTLMCALVLSSVMLSTMFISNKGQKVSKNFKESVQTLNAADAAIKQAKAELTAWLVSTQMASGTVTDYSPVLSQSQANGKLSIPGSATDWANMNIMGATVTVTMSDDEGSSDTDRISKITATAVSETRQRVQIEAYIQSPSETNTTGVPQILGAATFCNDSLGRRQIVKLYNSSHLDGRNYVLPSWPCTGAACAGGTLVGSGDNPPSIFFNSVKQKIETTPGSGFTGSPTHSMMAASPQNCDELQAFVEQVAQLSDSLPNVNVIDATRVSSIELGTRTEPTISILNGGLRITKRGFVRDTAFIDANSRGSGIMIMQYETSANDKSVGVGVKDNFYYEGLIVVYGDERAGFRQVASSIFGGIVLMTGSEDSAKSERYTLRAESRFRYSTQGIEQANSAIGKVGAALVPVTTVSDPRNQVITIGWAEVYGGA